MTEYGDCLYCGGEVEAAVERIDYRHHGQLFLVEGVSLGRCRQCGERFFTAETAARLERLAARGPHGVRTVAVPVLSADDGGT